MEARTVLMEHLYKMMTVELDVFTQEFKYSTPDECVDKAFELVSKRALASCFSYDNGQFSEDKIKVLIGKAYPLDYLYREWVGFDDDIESHLNDFINDTTSKELERQKHSPEQSKEVR